jgi:hypothetical protein
MPTAVSWPAATDMHFAEIATISGMSSQEWQDVLTEDPADQAILVAGWMTLGRMSWAAQPDKFARVIELLEVIGTIAGVVGGVAGAIGALRALL